MEQQRAKAALDALAQIQDDQTLSQVIVEMLKLKPQVCPAVVAATCPDLTYAPSKAITERRARGTIKTIHPGGGYGFISCPDIQVVFGCDVFAHAKQLLGHSPGTEVSFAILLNKDSKPQAFDIEDLGSAGKGGGMDMMKGGGGMDMMKGGGGMDMMKGGGGMDMMKGGGGMDPMGMKGMGWKGAMEMMGKGVAPQGSLKGGLKGKVSQTGELGEFMGTVKAFNPEKGFGFIHSEGMIGLIEGDVFLHESNLNGFVPGQQVKFTAYLHNGRAQAKNLEDATGMSPHDIAGMNMDMGWNDMDAGKGKGGSMGGQDMGKGPGFVGDTELGQFVGTVKLFNPQKGYGFLTCQSLIEQGYGDVFVHQKHIHEYQVGDIVTFSAFLHKGSQLQARELKGEPGQLPASKMPRLF